MEVLEQGYDFVAWRVGRGEEGMTTPKCSPCSIPRAA